MINLKPEEVWHHFKQISEIPRCSGDEEGVKDYVLEVAEQAGLESRVDDVGNVLLEDGDGPKVVLQAHMDMVCEKNSDVDHDFERDPIRLKEEDGWITAEGTTLGADNGIGVAIALAAITGDYDLGPLDCLFTVDEERGLNGASNLDPDYIRGARLVNLDSEEFGVFTIGCAGGGKTTLDLPVNHENCSGNVFKISIQGLVGGHSGADIDKGRANAIKLMARLIKSLDTISPELVELGGGDKHNAIPREAFAVVSADIDFSDFEKLLIDNFSVYEEEFAKTEPGINLDLERVPEKSGVECLDGESSAKLIDLISALPNGVMAYDMELESTVETSTNLASVALKDGIAKILMSSRSSRESKLENLRKNRIEVIGKRFGCRVEHNEAYPAWQPDWESDLLGKTKEVFEDLYGKSPEVKVVHGGLETGIIGEKKEDVEMIAMGPDIESPHSPEERMNIESVGEFWSFLLALLRELNG
jgi:dipeptidase D